MDIAYESIFYNCTMHQLNLSIWISMYYLSVEIGKISETVGVAESVALARLLLKSGRLRGPRGRRSRRGLFALLRGQRGAGARRPRRVRPPRFSGRSVQYRERVATERVFVGCLIIIINSFYMSCVAYWCLLRHFFFHCLNFKN